MVRNYSYEKELRKSYYHNLDKYLITDKKKKCVKFSDLPLILPPGNIQNKSTQYTNSENSIICNREIQPNQGINLIKALMNLENRLKIKNTLTIDMNNVNKLAYNNDEINYEFEIIKDSINNIKDLIELGKQYKSIFKPMKKKFSLNIRVLSDLVEPLEELNNMIGMENVKEAIFNKLILYLQGLGNNDYNHVVISGCPGMGKTHVAKIIGKIYTAMGLVSKGVFKEIKITDLKSGYLGQSELKTQKLLEDSIGNVLFLDEAYALGSDDKIDSFSQNIIDILNPFIEKHRENFILIVAGYKEDLNTRFFSGNQGLKSRFSLFIDIQPYSAVDLSNIFKLKIKENNWFYDDNDITECFFFKNVKYHMLKEFYMNPWIKKKS